jgi:hypothetical protein
VRHGKPDALRGACFGHEDFRARIGPDANRGGEFERAKDASLIARGRDGLPCAARAVVAPRRFPDVEMRRLGEKFVDRARGGTAKHMNVEFIPRAAHQRQTHHRVAKVVEFDNEQAGFHRANQRRFII